MSDVKDDVCELSLLNNNIHIMHDITFYFLKNATNPNWTEVRKELDPRTLYKNSNKKITAYLRQVWILNHPHQPPIHSQTRETFPLW